MFTDFQRTFRPTDVQKKTMVEQMKRVHEKLVSERHCGVCEYCYADLEQLPTGEFDCTERCALGFDHDLILSRTCDKWEERDAD